MSSVQLVEEAGLGTLERKVMVTIPADAVDQATHAQVQKTARTIRMPGFKPGKVPVKLVKSRYGKAIRMDVLQDLLQEHFVKALEEKSLNPVSQPKIDITSNEEGQDVAFSAVFEVMPTVSLDNLTGITVERKQAEVKSEDVDKMIDNLRQQRADWETVERAAENGDQLIIDFAGTVDGEAFDGGSAEDVPLELGSGRMIAGFEAGLEGASAGETRDLDLTFPEDYHSKDLAGKAAVFNVTVKQVQEKKLPELDKEFLDSFNVESADQLRGDIEKNMARELTFSLKADLKQQVFEAVIEANAFDVPKSVVDHELKAMQRDMFARMGIKDIDLEKLPPIQDEKMVAEATKRVKIGVIVTHLIEKDKLTADQAAVDEMIDQLATAYEDPAEVVAYYKSTPDRLTEVRNLVLEDQIIDRILADGEVTDKAVNFFDVVSESQVG